MGVHLMMISMPRRSLRRDSGLAKLQSTQMRYEIVDGVETRNWRPEVLPVAPNGWSLKAGEVGCYLAHLRALQRIVDYRLPWACILEDDFCFEADPDFGLAEIEPTLPAGFDFVHLQRDWNWNRRCRILETHGRYQRVCEPPYGATGYIITRALAESIVAKHQICRMPIDHLYCQLSYHGKFYKPIKPLIGIQLGLESVIQA
jgi:glycosyl transferase, family 25